MAHERRVLVLNHFAAPPGQAGGTRHFELFTRLTGWDHLIVASNLNPQTGERVKSEPGFSVVSVPSYTNNGFRRICNWFAYARRAVLLGLRQRRLDVVYGSSPHLLAPLAGWIIATVRRVPFVLEVRDLWPQVLVDMGSLNASSLTYRALVSLESFLYSRAAMIVVMARGTEGVLLKRGIPQSKLRYIPNGADPSDFQTLKSRDALRRYYGFERFTAVYTGAHGPANGLDLLLDASRDVPELDIVLVGGGIDKARLVKRAQAEQLNNVHFLDPVPKTEIPDVLAAADLGIHVLADVPLFQSAVSPNKVFDYMAAGRPVLTNCPGLVTDLVRESECGLGVVPHSLAEGLSKMVKLSTHELTKLGTSGRSWITTNQSRTAMARELKSALEKCVSAREPRKKYGRTSSS